MTAPDSTDVDSRDGQWTYHLADYGWVHAVTHLPTGTRIRYRGTLASARTDVGSGALLARVNAAVTQ